MCVMRGCVGEGVWDKWDEGVWDKRMHGTRGCMGREGA